MVKCKRKGIEFERKVKKYLESLGYVVIRSAASRTPDLVALKKGEKPKLIECKAGGKITTDEMKKLRELIDKSGAEAWVAYPKSKYINSSEKKFIVWRLLSKT